MRLLVTNDDGVFSPGLLALAELASSFGEVRIVAPDVEQSSMGHAITSSRPLTYRRTRIGSFDGFRVNGTPADCVALGIHNWELVDTVLSGINQGLNLGNAMWHSGTLAAAKQAVLFGVRGVALSAPSVEHAEGYRTLRPFAFRVLESLLSIDGEPRLYNVNLPIAPRGIHWTRQSVRHYDGKVITASDPQGRPIYWFSAIPLEDVDENTDRGALSTGHASVTPLRLDLTDEAQLASAVELHPFT